MRERIMTAKKPMSAFAPRPTLPTQREYDYGRLNRAKQASSLAPHASRLQRARIGSEPVATVPPVVQKTLNAPGHPLDRETRAFMEPRFGHDFSRVRVHTDAPSARSAQALNAQAYTAGHDVVFGAGQYAPHAPAGRELLAHELAHVVQQKPRQDAGTRGNTAQAEPLAIDQENGPAEREAVQASRAIANPDLLPMPLTRMGTGLQRQPAPPAAPVALPTQLADYPEAERLQIQVSEAPLDGAAVGALNTFFQPPTGGVTVSTPPPGEVMVVMGTGMPANLQRGLNNVVGTLLTQTTPSPIPMNTTLAVAIPAAGMVFRFTHLQHRVNRTTTQDVVLVEALGALPAAQAAAPPTAASPTPGARTPATTPAAVPSPSTTAAPRPTSSVTAAPTATPTPGAAPTAAPTAAQIGQQKIVAHHFTFSARWTPGETTAIQEALAQIPDAVLRNNLQFERAAVNTTNPNEAGEFDPNTNTITIYNRAFIASFTRYGLATALVHTLAHELGHAADDEPQNNAFQAFNAAGQTPPARRTLLGARSLSGQRYIQPTPGADYESVEAARDMTGAFRNAAVQDGVHLAPAGQRTNVGTVATLTRGITSYADTNWQEFFADAFSMYIADPDTLRRLRPHIYDYFTTRYPDPARPPRVAPAGGHRP